MSIPLMLQSSQLSAWSEENLGPLRSYLLAFQAL